MLTRLCIGLLPRAGFVDMPDARRVHRKPTPRGGGIAIIAAFFLTSVLYVERHASAQMGGFVAGFALPAFVIVVCGLLDDRFSLASRTKLVIQILAGVLVWAFSHTPNTVASPSSATTSLAPIRSPPATFQPAKVLPDRAGGWGRFQGFPLVWA